MLLRESLQALREDVVVVAAHAVLSRDFSFFIIFGISLGLLVARRDDDLVVAAVRGLVQDALQREVGPLLGVVDVGAVRNTFAPVFERSLGRGLRVVASRKSAVGPCDAPEAAGLLFYFAFAAPEPFLAPLLRPVALGLLKVEDLLAVRTHAVGHAKVREDVGCLPVAPTKPGLSLFALTRCLETAECYVRRVMLIGRATVLVIRKARRPAELIRKRIIIRTPCSVGSRARLLCFR